MTFHWKRRIKGKRKNRALFPLFRFPCRSRQHTLYIIRHELNDFHSINTFLRKRMSILYFSFGFGMRYIFKSVMNYCLVNKKIGVKETHLSGRLQFQCDIDSFIWLCDLCICQFAGRRSIIQLVSQLNKNLTCKSYKVIRISTETK